MLKRTPSLDESLMKLLGPKGLTRLQTRLQQEIRAQQLLDSIDQALSLDADARRAKAEHDAIVACFDRLTPREREVVDLVVEGMTNKIIAARLGVSAQAIDAHRAKAMDKLRAASIPELV